MILDSKFKLAPSKRVFSRIKADLYFDGHHVKSFYVGIPYYLLRPEDFPLRSVLGLDDISAGEHIIRLEMLGLWPSAGQSDTRETRIQYQAPQKIFKVRVVPTFKNFRGPDVVIVTEEEDRLYEEMKERWKKEILNRREKW